MPTSPVLPAAVLSDMDGLLLDTERLSQRVFNDLAAEYGFSDDGTIFNQLVGLNKKDHQRVFARNLPQGIVADKFDARWKEKFLGHLDRDIPVKPGAREMLAWLKAAGVPVSLVTSTASAKAAMLMQRSGLIEFLDVLTCGDEIERGKPAPDIYLLAAERLGCVAADCIAFEDSANGVKAAHSSGARVVQVVDLLPPSSELRALGHDIVDTLAEAGALLGWDFMPG